MESRKQRSWSRPRTQKKSEAKAKDSPFEDRPSRGQRQECSRPRPRNKDKSESVLSKKKGLQRKFFRRSPQKKKTKRSSKFFQAFFRKKTFSKIFFQSIYKISTIQKKCCPQAEDRAIFEDLRPQGQGLDLRGQGLQNVSSRTPPLLIIFIHQCSKVSSNKNISVSA